VIQDNCQNEPGVDPSLINAIVSGTVAERCHGYIKGQPISIHGHWQDLSVEIQTPLHYHH